MDKEEKILNDRFERLGFNYQKMLPKMYVREHAFVLMDAEWLGQAGPDQKVILFTLIVCTPVVRPPFIAMLKAVVKKASDLSSGYDFKKEHWFYDGEFPTRKELIEQMTSFQKTQNIQEKFSNKEDNQLNSKKRKL